MRLHALSVTAFGPFAETVRVDFDDLSGAGLFLLTGPTGAGKSSVLDAVCFALYGQVPGDRQAARQLRCDRAAAGVAPRVVLECSLRGRRFRFARSPQWERAKKRGTGTAKQQASVVVEELRDGAWQCLTTRLDDAGLLVGDLLGMTCSQFTQVAMLPQGRFMTFLRARSEERQKVLQTLFRTDRFERVERWLADHRVSLRRAGQAANDRVAGVLNRLQEAADVSVPHDWDLADLALPAGDGAVTAWAADLVAAASQQAARSDVLLREAEAAVAGLAEAVRGAEQLDVLQARGRQALGQRAALEAEADEAAADQARLHRHQRAVPVLRLVEGARRAHRAADDAHRIAEAELQRAVRLVGDIADLAAAEDAATSALAVAEAFVPRQRELDEQSARCTRLADERLALAAEVEELQQRLADLPADLASATAALAAAQDAARRVVDAAARGDAATAARTAAEELTRVTAEIETLVAEAAAARDTAQQLREHYLDVREQRIHGMAAELAGALVSGCACPVCGSAEHPHPSSAMLGAVGRAEEEEARKQHEQADFEHQLLSERLAERRTREAALQATSAGLDPAEALRRQQLALAELDELRELAADLDSRREALDGLQQRSAGLEQRRGELETRLTDIRTSHQAASEQVERLTAELALLLRDTGADSLADLVDQRRAARAAVVTARTAGQQHELARAAADHAAAALADAAGQAGFADAAEAARAGLPDHEARTIEERLLVRRDRAAAVAAVLADDEVRSALEQPTIDLHRLRAEHGRVVAERDAAAVAAETATRRLCRLDALVADLDAALTAWAPLRADLATATGLAALVEGKGPDNALRMRLSAYVLGERLRQVVAAANERLDRMSGSRYALEQSDDRAAGDLRGGLSLLVCDAWSGQSRDPATLSGGETFIVSLALALGLADTVSHEAGGTDVDTLFIDEGFGTLDADTLDDVMDTLDSLREGGRVVGLVSHVPELRTRIPTRLEVTKTRAGSRVRALHATG